MSNRRKIKKEGLPHLIGNTISQVDKAKKENGKLKSAPKPKTPTGKVDDEKVVRKAKEKEEHINVLELVDKGVSKIGIAEQMGLNRIRFHGGKIYSFDLSTLVIAPSGKHYDHIGDLEINFDNFRKLYTMANLQCERDDKKNQLLFSRNEGRFKAELPFYTDKKLSEKIENAELSLKDKKTVELTLKKETNIIRELMNPQLTQIVAEGKYLYAVSQVGWLRIGSDSSNIIKTNIGVSILEFLKYTQTYKIGKEWLSFEFEGIDIHIRKVDFTFDFENVKAELENFEDENLNEMKVDSEMLEAFTLARDMVPNKLGTQSIHLNISNGKIKMTYENGISKFEHNFTTPLKINCTLVISCTEISRIMQEFAKEQLSLKFKTGSNLVYLIGDSFIYAFGGDVV